MTIKKPYEISLWEDVVKYVGVNGVEYNSVSEMSVAVDYQYYTEQRIVTLGSDTMTSSLARAINPVYTRNINGTETLTFEMYYQYEEPETGEIVHNPLIDLVVDERKVKLKYEVAPDDLWHEFIVKKNDERARDNKYSFTCTGLAANELGKTGFNIEFNVELENNIGTVDELAQVVLDGSDWQLDTTQTELIQQRNNEALYKIYLGTSLTGTSIRDNSVTRTIAANSIIYAYYTPYANKEENYFQFIYTTNATPALLEDGITIHCNDTDTFDLYCTGVTYNNDGVPTFVRYTSGVANVSVAQYRGERYVRKQLSHYDSVLEQTVGVYSKNGVSVTKDYYGYSETEYLGVDSVTNYIYNSTGYTATNYWNMYDELNGSSLSQITYPDVGPNNVRDDTGFASYLKIKFANINARLKNDGILQNYNRINRFERGQQYVFRIKINQAVLDSSGKITRVVPITSNSPINCKIVKYNPGYVITGNGTVIYFNFTSFVNDEGYLRAVATCAADVNWSELGKQIGIFIVPVNAALNNTYLIEDAQFYRYVIGDNNQPLRINDVPVNRIRTNWHFYDPELNLGEISADDYVYDGTNPANYIAKYGIGDKAFEKKRSITASESNRFNLLQELSETFECWVRFKIYHDLDGTITIETYDYYKPVEATAQTYSQYYIYDQNIKTYVTPTEYDENKQYYEKVDRKRQKKRVYFYESVTSENYIGFKYGINLKDVNRVLDSEQIATKIIVKDNTREEAPNGFCSIARAEDNPIRENFAINLDYYTSQGIINKSNLDNDIYLENVSGSIGLYPRLARFNQERNSLIEEQAELSNNITNERAQVQTHKLKLDEATNQLSKLLDPESGTLKRYSGFVYDDFGNQYTRTSNHVNPAYGSTIYYIKTGTVSAISPTPSIIVKRTTDTEKQSGKTYYIINSNHQFEEWQQTRLYTTHIYYEATTGYAAGNLFQTTAGTTTLTITGSGSPDVRIYMAYAQITHSDEDSVLNGTNLYYSSVVETLTKIKTYTIQREDSRVEYEKYNEALIGTETETGDLERLDIIKERLKEIEQGTEEVEREFNVKYARYIQEGSWTDDNYIDDNLYYLDALNVLYQSAYPKVTYNISVLELSQLEGYEAYKFDLGHKTFIEDIEFFGWKLGQVGYEPAKEWVVVTESKFDLDNNDKNNLKVQNYKSHFEDLFQRITAATQSLEYHTGEYQKAAAAVTPEGAINEVAMQRSFATAAFVIQNSHDQSVTWDDTGLQAINLSDPAQIVRLASGGILISTDGGQTWGVAITGYGINANYIYTGTLDTEHVNILSGAFPTFKWDGTGLHAFAFSKDNATGQLYSYDPSRFVTFDRFGIYGTNGLTSTAGFNKVEDVEANADYALTWNGLFIRSKHRDGYTSISPYNDITLVDTSGDSEVVRAQLGQLIYDPITDNELDNAIFGLVLRDQIGNPTVVTQDDGTLWLLDSMRIGTAGQTNTIYIGVGEQDPLDITRYKVINVNDLNDNEKFVVYSDGTLKASGANIEGTITATDGTFNGIVNANGGVFNGTVYATDGEFTGIIHATSGEFIGTVTATDGIFNGTVNAIDGEFNGTITTRAGNIGGFTINEHSIVSEDGSLELYSSYSVGRNLVESRINVKNVDIGTGAKIAQYLQIGNLRLLNPEIAESHQNVLELKDQGTDTNYFTLTNTGEIIGNNWHIAKNGNGDIEAEFDLLRVNDGYFKGTINATDGNFSGIIDASVINATTINAVNFNSERLRSMGGAFIFRPNIPIARELTTADIDHIYVVVTDSEYYPYFGYNDATSSYNGAIGEIVLLGGENIDVSAITNDTTSRYGKIDDIDILPIEDSENYYLKISIDVGDNVVNIPESAFEYYKNIMLFGRPTDENNKGDVVIGINSDDNTAIKFLPKHSLTMAHFSDLIGDTFSQTYVDPEIKLLLGELDSLHKTYVNGYGLYAENVFLTGSLITEYTYNKENLNENSPTYAGVNTTNDSIRLRKSTEASYGRDYFNPNGTLERPIFWGGAKGLSEEAINRAPLILTDQGNIYAMSGVFSGTIISNSIISETVLKAPVIYGTNKQDGVSLKLVNTTEFGQSGNFGGIGFYELVGELDSYNYNTSINEYIYGVNYQIVDVLIRDKGSNEIVDADIYFLDEKSIKIVLKEQYNNALIIVITSFDNETNILHEDRFETKNYESNDLLTLLITSNGFYHYYNSNLRSEDPKNIKFIDFSRGSEFISFNGNKLTLENTTFVDNKISRASSSILLDNGSKMVLAYSTGAVEVGAEGVHCTGAVQTMDKQVVFADGVRMSYRKTGNYYCLYVEDD